MFKSILSVLSVPRGADGAVTVVSNIGARYVLEELNWTTHRRSALFCTPLNRDKSMCS
jgi:hypothetical protein